MYKGEEIQVFDAMQIDTCVLHQLDAEHFDPHLRLVHDHVVPIFLHAATELPPLAPDGLLHDALANLPGEWLHVFVEPDQD